MSSRSPAPPYLSVITPLYNCLPLSQAMVRSLQASIPSWVSYEVILVDDCSTDGTRDWLAGLGAPFRVVLNEENLGFGASTNRGPRSPGDGSWRSSTMTWSFAAAGSGPCSGRWLARLERAGLVGNVQFNAATLEVDHAGNRRRQRQVQARARPAIPRTSRRGCSAPCGSPSR